ncbi:MAG: phage holin family protein [Erythrobacter sp.]
MREDEKTGRSGSPASLDDEGSLAALDDAQDSHGSSADEDAGEFDESLTEEIAALIDDGRTYAETEIAFQKTRASLAGRKIGGALLFAILALILLHIAFITLAVGVVIALEPLVTIWGAIGIVVGALILGVIGLVLLARKNAMRLVELFGTDSE